MAPNPSTELRFLSFKTFQIKTDMRYPYIENHLKYTSMVEYLWEHLGPKFVQFLLCLFVCNNHVI